MKNVTILLAVVAMFAVTAQAAPLVDEDFSSDPGWSRIMHSCSDFNYNSTAEAITGTSKHWTSHTCATCRYYTTAGGSIALDQDSTFTSRFDVTLLTDDASNIAVRVGLMSTTAGEVDPTWNELQGANSEHYFGITTHDWGKRLGVIRYDSDGQSKLVDILGGFLTLDRVYHCELIYNGAGGVTANVTWDAAGSATYTGTGWDKKLDGVTDATWSCDAFGTNNKDDGGNKTQQAVVDNLYLVPEPATMALLGLGGIGVLLRRRKK